MLLTVFLPCAIPQKINYVEFLLLTTHNCTFASCSEDWTTVPLFSSCSTVDSLQLYFKIFHWPFLFVLCLQVAAHMSSVFDALYSLSYVWYIPFSGGLTVVLGLIVSLITSELLYWSLLLLLFGMSMWGPVNVLRTNLSLCVVLTSERNIHLFHQ